ncbi:aminoglycoside phosphotransferase family protein [Aestuariimicrobium sp. p3-SID1156]|nr:aminoglycoside phosphotransferase family protein [Aestuariimicrobium sp. p3-SID1156]MCT1460045.1 aminoglycoside phosphotransferase family protein [Aestuariimicrobium sp. p3-SID1156]
MVAGPHRQGDDGSRLLASRDVGDLLEAATHHAGGELLRWQMDHIDAHPGHSTTATYAARVRWPYGERDELLGVSARIGPRTATDNRADIFADGDREVAVWLYPKDPDLPGLMRAAYPERMAELVNEYNLVGRPVSASQISLAMIGYRPRRRAVLRMDVANPAETFYVKVQRQKQFEEVLLRHNLLLEAGVPAPVVAAATPEHLLVLKELDGRSLARAIFDPTDPCTAEQLIEILDQMPASAAQLERRPPWTDAVAHYATMVEAAMPSQKSRLDWMVHQIEQGLVGIEPGNEPTHGDFHEGQVFVKDGRVSGILDIDTVGPGRRADDLACMIAHLSTVQRMNAEQAGRVHHLIRTWVPVFDTRVDPVELRLRAAAVIISLATGPYRGQEPSWEGETIAILDSAEALVRQVS